MSEELRYTIGADPEVFLVDATGKFISSVGKFGGTKQNPIYIGNNAFLQEDNVALEFNIPAANLYTQFTHSINYCLTTMTERAREFGLTIAIVPSAEFTVDQLRTKAAREFGCEPDMNVWTLRQNPRPKATNKNLRSAGGHVHIGYNQDAIGLGRACDLFLGCPSIVYDDDRRRRELYGKAGAIRIKPYGIEYRTLSNFWIKSSTLHKMVFEQVQQAVNFIDTRQTISNEDGEKIIQCINNADRTLLAELTKKYGLKY